MNKRRSLTPHTGMQAPGTHAMRRGGARQTVSDRVTFKRDDKTLYVGWALNVSRGGLRAILEPDAPDAVDARSEGHAHANPELGEEYDVVVGDPDADGNAPKRGRIVWLQEEPDGFVVGVEYQGLSGSYAAAPVSSVAASVAPPSTATSSGPAASPAAAIEPPAVAPLDIGGSGETPKDG